MLTTSNNKKNMNIDKIAEEIVNQYLEEVYLDEKYTGKNRDALLQSTREYKKQAIKKMLHQMDYNESMFSAVEHPYTVAKSLYFMLAEDSLSDEEKVSTVKLCYFCLLKNYLKNKDVIPINLAFEDLISGCKLILVLISMQSQYLMYSVIAGQANYINPQTHIRNQVLLFGGIIKETEIMVDTDFVWSVEAIIKNNYVSIYKELESHLNLPTKSELLIYKEKYTPIIEHIATSISNNLKEPADWMDY